MDNERKLIVKYNQRIVGYLAELKDNRIAFQYDDEWLETGFSISPISLPLSSNVYINNNPAFDGLYGVFWDTLPDGWGQLLVQRKLLQYHINYDQLSPLQKLALISSNGLGALEYEPTKELSVVTKHYDLDELSHIISTVLNNQSNDDLDTLYSLGGSSGGARPKAHITLNNQEWIIKFPCLTDSPNIGEEEYNLNMLAQKCGIQTAQCHLFPSKKCTGYFGSLRFDRKDQQKIHTISLCGLLEVSHRMSLLDYGHLLHFTNIICSDKSNSYEAFRRMCFNVYAQNKDDHGKNFSFIYDEQTHSYWLSPAYDLTPTPHKFEHEMTVNHNGNPQDSDILQVAKDLNLSLTKCTHILNHIKSIFK